MLLQLLLVGSLDSFLATAGIGLAGFPNIHKRRIIVGLAACDTLASLLGGWLPVGFRSFATALVLLAVLIAFSVRKAPAIYLALALVLSLDNFIAANSAAHVAGLAPISGAFSGLAAMAGFLAGERAARIFSATGVRFATVALFSLALLY
jgi:hypothetical protein